MGESLKNDFLTQLTCSQGTDRTKVGIPRCHWLGMSPASNYVLKASAGSPKGARWDGTSGEHHLKSGSSDGGAGISCMICIHMYTHT